MAGKELQVALADAGAQLQKMAPKFTAALPNHIKQEKFQRVVMTSLNQNPDLLGCDRLSLFNSCVKCAQDGLLPDGREAALVPFKGQVQYMPMVYGLIKRTRQSGELASLSAHVVYENDHFDYALGDDERIDHKPHMGADRGQIIAAYAIAKLKDGTVQREVMTKAEIEEVRNVSRAKNAGPWSQWYGEMARKTVVRRLCKYLPLSADLIRTVARDNWMAPYDDGFTEEDAESVRDITPEKPRPKPADYQPATNGKAGTVTEAAEQPRQEASDFPGDRPPADRFHGTDDDLHAIWRIPADAHVEHGLKVILNHARSRDDVKAVQAANQARIDNLDKQGREAVAALLSERAQALPEHAPEDLLAAG